MPRSTFDLLREHSSCVFWTSMNYTNWCLHICKTRTKHSRPPSLQITSCLIKPDHPLCFLSWMNQTIRNLYLARSHSTTAVKLMGHKQERKGAFSYFTKSNIRYQVPSIKYYQLSGSKYLLYIIRYQVYDISGLCSLSWTLSINKK